MDELFDDDIDIFFCPLDHEQLDNHIQKNITSDLAKSKQNQNKLKQFSHAIPDSNFSLSNRKTKIIHKTNQPESIKKQDNKNYQGFSNPSLEKKEKNRIAAKQSRDRKKLYLQLMEKQQKKLQTQINQIDADLNQTKTKINIFLKQNKAVTGFSSLAQSEAKLQKLITNENPQSVQEQINFVLDSLLWRMGVLGKDRVIKTNQCFKQIINLSLPALHRYLLWSASQKQHLFELDEGEEQVGQENISQKNEFLKQMIQVSGKKKENIEKLKNLQPAISKQKQKLISSIQQLQEVKKKIQNQSHILQNQINTLRDILSPTQIANLTLITNRNKFREEINFLKSEKQQQQELRFKPSKKVKFQEN